ncbi:hypothetical protein TNCV_2079371 [Trichonephila clavipes]|nr:hypothetical protein TNCV_2079371 [Trichonephila clavipes]
MTSKYISHFPGDQRNFLTDHHFGDLCARVLTDVKRKEKPNATLQNVVVESLAIYLEDRTHPPKGLELQNGPPR